MKEEKEISTNLEQENKELTEIYIKGGLDKNLATQVATQLMINNVLEAHAKDELGINEMTQPKPLQAA